MHFHIILSICPFSLILCKLLANIEPLLSDQFFFLVVCPNFLSLLFFFFFFPSSFMLFFHTCDFFCFRSYESSSKIWLKKHGLVAKRLTILDALAPTLVPHRSKYIPILDKHVLARVFDEVSLHTGVQPSELHPYP